MKLIDHVHVDVADDIPLAILILAKEYVDAATGVTHFTTTVSVNYHHVYKSTPQLGSGLAYVNAAGKWLDDNAVVTLLDDMDLAQYCHATGISLTTSIITVSNYSDLCSSSIYN